MLKYIICKIFVSISETAINVGYSCQLLTDELVDVFIVDGTTADEVQLQLQRFRDSIRIVNTYQPRSPNGRGTTATDSSGETSNGGIGARSESTAPSITLQAPAVSVVTFRWDTDANNTAR